MPSRHFAINAVWLGLAVIAADLLAWTQNTLLDGDLAKAEPKELRSTDYPLVDVPLECHKG